MMDATITTSPWGQDKPCVCVECSWEDIAFRLEPVNILTKMAERLVSDRWCLSLSLVTLSIIPSENQHDIVRFPLGAILRIMFPTLACEFQNVERPTNVLGL